MGRGARRLAAVTVDTNILLRLVVDDDPAQGLSARDPLARSDLVAVPIMAPCELVWVLSRSFRLPLADIAATIRHLIAAEPSDL